MIFNNEHLTGAAAAPAATQAPQPDSEVALIGAFELSTLLCIFWVKF